MVNKEIVSLHNLMDEIDYLTAEYEGEVSEKIIYYLNQARNQASVEYRDKVSKK